ncbi:hypothetical protein H0H81_008328 [Sphagnurus paluster]|uniref:Uncharacterized protein n=1 Tax=Sphagnurus paluster TaxID=117069 RepID=A0A9P7GT30_9AGAR|nr:hypothetical protein H0H81_008328 [Sphagnurus paluster]
MSTPRVAFANSTNIPRSNSRPTSTRFVSKLGSRKSAPTCTVSLANVNANDLCANLGSISSSPSTTPTNLIPFPSSSTESSTTTISQPDRTCLLLLRSSPETDSQLNIVIFPAQERRKRATARLPQGFPLGTSDQGLGAEPQSQPPRKRPRLQKSAKATKRTSPASSAEARFLAMVQRSVAGGVLERRAAHSSSNSTDTFETQDKLLASRLRSRLLTQGLKETDLVDLDREVQPSSRMDVDVETQPSSVTSVDMDIDVECPPRLDLPTPSILLSSPPRRPVPPNPDSRLSTRKLVALLMLRHQCRRPTRPASERRDPSKAIPRKSSPLSTPSI